MPRQIKHIFHEQKRSRKKAQIGDVFVVKLDEGYLHGRVVSVTANPFTLGDPDDADCLMLYFYAGVAVDPLDFSLRSFTPPHLLIPPVITNEMGWRHGYFLTVGNVDLSEDQLLARHQFRDLSTGELWDEGSTRFTAREIPPLPIGKKVLASYMTIEDLVSQALGSGPTIQYD